jgi:hypothetical protein
MNQELRSVLNAISAGYGAISPYLARLPTFLIAFIGGLAALYLPRIVSFLSSLDETVVMDVTTSLYTRVAIAFALFIALYVTLENMEDRKPPKDVLRAALLAPAVLASLLNINMQRQGAEGVNAQLTQALDKLGDKSGLAAPLEATETFLLVDPGASPLADDGVGMLDWIVPVAYAQDATGAADASALANRQLRAPTQTVGQRLGVQVDPAQYVVVLKTRPQSELEDAVADVATLRGFLPTVALAQGKDGAYRVLLTGVLQTRYDATMRAIETQTFLKSRNLDDDFQPALVRLQAPAEPPR